VAKRRNSKGSIPPRKTRRPHSAREERRRLAFHWLRHGVPKAEVARRLGVSYRSVYLWEKRQVALGPNGWRERKHPGPAPRLTKEQRKELQEILLEGARARGYETDLWTLKRMAEVIEDEFGVQYTESGAWRLLKDMGFSAQVPARRALERNERYIRHWVREEWPSIQERARRTGATVLFLDESCAQSLPNVRRTWAPTGERPELPYRQGDRLKLNLISAVSAEGTLLFDIHEDNIDGTRVIWFLEQLLEEIPGRLMVVWDNGRIHRSVEVKTFLWENRRRLETRRFPPYAPELDPDEQVWVTLKHQRLANFCPKTGEELRAAVERELRDLQAHPEVVESFLRASDLPLPPTIHVGPG
jgi:transposase